MSEKRCWEMDYSLKAKLNDSYALTMHELFDSCNMGIEYYERVTAYHKLQNAQKTGIVDRINKYLHLDINLSNETDRQERFDIFKLIKYIYEMENDYGIPILHLLSKPRMEHFSIFSEKVTDQEKKISTITETMEELFTEDIIQRYHWIPYQIFGSWNEFTDLFYRIVRNIEFRDNDHGEKCMKYISEHFNLMLDGIDKIENAYEIERTDPILLAFYQLLCKYPYKCYIVDMRDKLKNQVDTSLDSELLKMAMKKFGTGYVSFDILNRLEKYVEDIPNVLLGKLGDTGEAVLSELLLILIYSGLSGIKMEPKDIRFAVKHMRTVLEWANIKGATDQGIIYNDQEIIIYIAVPIIQELIYVSNTKASYLNDYLNYKHRTTFTSILKNPEKADEIGKNLLLHSVEYRISVCIAQKNAHKILQYAEDSVYQIIEYILSFKNINDMIFMHDFLYHYVMLYILPGVTESPVSVNDLKKMLHKQCRNFEVNTVEVEAKARPILYCDQDVIEHIVQKMAKNADASHEMEGRDVLNRIIVNGKIKGLESIYEQEIALIFIIKKAERQIILTGFMEMYPDEYIERMKTLKLNSFLEEAVED